MVRYVVTGATGQLGSRVFKHLIQLVDPYDVIVSLYNPSGATPTILDSGVEVRHGDFLKPETLDKAYAGADKLLIVSYPSINYDVRVQSHKAAIDAAKRVGIKHIYYTSLAFASDSQAFVMKAHVDTEAYLKASGVTYTIIREGIYSESFPLYIGYWDPSRGDEMRIPEGDGGIAWVCRDDLGEGTAKLMVSDTHQNETILFSGSRAFTLTDTAAIITKILTLNPPLKVKIIPVDEYIATNQGGEELLSRWATTFPAVKRGELAVVDPLLQNILGRELVPFEETLREAVLADAGADAVQQYSRNS